MSRRALLLLLCCLAFPAVAQPYPSKPIRLVIPWPAGAQKEVA